MELFIYFYIRLHTNFVVHIKSIEGKIRGENIRQSFNEYLERGI